MVPTDGKDLELSEQRNQEIDLVPSFAISLEEAKKRLAQLQEFVKDQMIPNEDYGIIPGCKKPSLYKAGAEKLAILYGFAPRFVLTDSVKDWQQGFFHYQIKCELVSKRTGQIVAEGVGSCNSKENKYRNSDAFTLDNTILKMAKKRSIVDAVLTATRTSGLFTQDMEDIQDTSFKEQPESTESKPHIEQDQSNISGTVVMASDSQAKAVFAICKSRKMTNDDIAELLQNEYGVSNTHDLTKQQASALIDKLQKAK